MIIKGKRQDGIPMIVSDLKSLRLERIPLNEKLFRESYIQEIIYDNPEILPVNEIESAFSPLIPMGKEIPTLVGKIDNLYIAPNGYITIVETKLWRNPEAKRQVVGQIIDYAKELTTWNYTKLNNAIKLKNDNLGIIDILNKYEELDVNEEINFIDNVDRNLKRGRFLLLIVGDGIRESVEDMIDYLENLAQLQFTLGLIELKIYKVPDSSNELLIIPNVITRTREITRAIIKIEGNEIVQIESNFSTNELKKGTKRSTISESDFLEQLLQNTNHEIHKFAQSILNDVTKMGLYIDWKQASFSVKLPDPNGSGRKITLFVIDKKGTIYIGWLEQQLKSLNLDSSIGFDYCHEIARLLKEPVVKPNTAFWERPCDLKYLQENYSEFMELVKKFIDKIIEESNKNMEG